MRVGLAGGGVDISADIRLGGEGRKPPSSQLYRLCVRFKPACDKH